MTTPRRIVIACASLATLVVAGVVTTGDAQSPEHTVNAQQFGTSDGHVDRLFDGHVDSAGDGHVDSAPR